MLKEVDQNIDNMGSPSNSPDVVQRVPLAIHQTNVFQPQKYSITCMASSPQYLYLATRRGFSHYKKVTYPFSQLDIYETTAKTCPRHMQTFIVYEDITGLAWLDERHLISVSRQSTINLYSVHKGVQISTFTSDYGSITCMRYSIEDDLLITGTEYGYAVAYKMNLNDNKVNIECHNRMVKLNESINCIDFYSKLKETLPVIEAPAIQKPKIKAKKPSKRKRVESSDESDDDEDSNPEESLIQNIFLANKNITIFGACATKVVAWDYHRKTIIDTVIAENTICSLLALHNGDFAIGDVEGYLNIHDKNTFTCRQSEKIMKSSVTCLARDKENSTVIATGKEPTITILHQKRVNADDQSAGDEYILQEHIKDHAEQINDAICVSREEFFTCSVDNTIIKFKLKFRKKQHRKLKRYVIRDNFESKIQWNTNELGLLHDKKLSIYKLDNDTAQFRSEIVSYPVQQSLQEPPRTCSIRPGLFIHSATFDDKWICYSTKQGIVIIDRPGLTRRGVPSRDLPECHTLKLCQSGKYLIAGTRSTLTITKLEQELVMEKQQEKSPADINQSHEKSDVTDGTQELKNDDDSPAPVTYKTMISFDVKGCLRSILYHEATNLLIVWSGTVASLINIFQLPSPTSISGDNKGKREQSQTRKLYHTSVMCSVSSPVTLNYNDPSDTNLYILTPRNQLLRYDITSHKAGLDLNKHKSVKGLPKGCNILGMIILTRRYALLYDSKCLYKLDMDANNIVNSTPSYDTINMVCDTIFSRQDEILVI